MQTLYKRQTSENVEIYSNFSNYICRAYQCTQQYVFLSLPTNRPTARLLNTNCTEAGVNAVFFDIAWTARLATVVVKPVAEANEGEDEEEEREEIHLVSWWRNQIGKEKERRSLRQKSEAKQD